MCHTKAPRPPHCTGQTQPVKATLLRRAAAIFWHLRSWAQEAKWVIDSVHAFTIIFFNLFWTRGPLYPTHSTILLTLGTATLKPFSISSTKSIASPMNPTRRKLGTVSKNWSLFWNPYLWTITMPSLPAAANCAPPTNAKPSMTVCFTAHTCCRSCFQRRLPKNHPIPAFCEKPFLCL